MGADSGAGATHLDGAEGLASAREEIRRVLELLCSNTNDRWLLQMVPLGLGILYRGLGIDSTSLLQDLLQSEVDSARHYSAMALGMMCGSDQDCTMILELAESAGDSHVRAGAIEGLTLVPPHLRGSTSGDLALRSTSPSLSPNVRQSAYRALGQLYVEGAGAEGLSRLEEGASDESLGESDTGRRTEVRRGVIEGLGVAFQGTGSTRAASLLSPFLNDWENYFLVAEAAFSLGIVFLGTRNREALQALDVLLDHEEPHVRWNTGLAMGLIYWGTGDAGIFDWVERPLCDADLAVRYYTSLGISLAYCNDLVDLCDYYDLQPRRLQEYVASSRALPNVDGLLTSGARLDLMAGLGAHLQGYSSWYALPFFKRWRSGSLDEATVFEFTDLLTLVSAHRFEDLRRAGGVAVYSTLSRGYARLRTVEGCPVVAVGLGEFWLALDGLMKVRARSHVAELGEGVSRLSAAMRGAGVLDLLTEPVSALSTVVSAARLSGDAMGKAIAEAEVVIEARAFLGYGHALRELLNVWRSVTDIE